MSTIDRLSMRGIRSFGIKSEDQQVIVFSAPLTLILGANGSGKTTIIECLKYALTGELPPGSDKGKSFVHDPKIFGCPESWGQVKLVVKNLRNEKLTITRSMKTGFKRGKPFFETVDPGTITYGEGDAKSTITKRCTDVNKEMSYFMGVSKAIINNVLFCHQEDSDWPLDEAKKLKEKFDAIFGTTEYNKAIDKIIKLRKNQMDKLKTKEFDLRTSIGLKKETESKNMSLQNAEQKLQSLKNTHKKLEDDMKPVQNRIEHIMEIELEAGKLLSKRTELKTKLESCKEQSNNVKSKIKTLFTGNLSDLEGEIRLFETKMNFRKDKLSETEKELSTLQKQHEQIVNILVSLDKQAAMLISKRQKEQECLSDRADRIRDLCRKMDISAEGDLEQSASSVELIMKNISTAFSSREKEISEMNAENEKYDLEMQNKIDQLREEKASIESSIRSKLSQRSQLNSEQGKIQNEIISIERAAKDLKKLNESIERLDRDYQELDNSVDQESLKALIEECKKNVFQLEEKDEKIDRTLAFLNSISKLTAEIDLKEHELKKRETEVKRVKNKNMENFNKIFANRSIQSNFKRALQSEIETLQTQMKDIGNQIKMKTLREKELQTIRKNQKEELVKSEKELEESKEKIYDQCRSTPYEEVLARAKENIERLQLDHGALKSSDAMYKRYIKKVEDDPCCPLCHKDMSQNEASDLKTELSDEIHRLPDRIERIERQLKMEHKNYEELLRLKPVIERVELLDTNVPRLKQKLNQTEEQLSDTTNEIESLQIAEAEPNGLLEIARSMSGDLSVLDEAVKDVNRLVAELETIKKKLPERTEDMSCEEAQREKTSITKSLRCERTHLNELREKHIEQINKLNKLKEQLNKLKDERIKRVEQVQTLEQFKARVNEMKAEIEQINKYVKELESKLGPMKFDLEKLTREKEEMKNKNRQTVQSEQMKLNSLLQVEQDINRFTREIEELRKLNLVEEIDRIKNSIKDQTEAKKLKVAKNKELQEIRENIKSDIRNAEIQERDLCDNKDLKILQEKEEGFQKLFDELNKDIGDLDFSKLKVEKEQLANERDLLTKKTGEIIGKMGEVNNQINGFRNELNQPKYRYSIINYKKDFYEVQVLKKLIADLAQYRSALDYALMKFHEEKMNQINRLIREFWRQIYRGNDIDYIQIQTIADDMKTESIDKKRSYNYRVIQSKNSSEIDMRGRCSAGQRVLSSLIIRMALAETFSSNCGVLALDEPTTNLDRNNIHSLCEALNKIVEERQMQSNFMLIIITHDEEFIQTLGQVTTYHTVSRNVDGKSIIQKVKIQ